MSENLENTVFTGQGIGSYRPTQTDKANLNATAGLIMGIISAVAGDVMLFVRLIAAYLIPNSIWAVTALFGILIILSIIGLIFCIKAKRKGATSAKALIGILINPTSMLFNGYIFIQNIYIILSSYGYRWGN